MDQEDRALWDAGPASGHARNSSKVAEATEKSDNREIVGDANAEADWENQDTDLDVNNNDITGVYPHVVVEQWDKIVQEDTEDGDVIEQTIKLEPVKTMHIAATTSDPGSLSRMTDTTGVRDSNPGVTTAVKDAPGMDAATTAAPSRCPSRERKALNNVSWITCTQEPWTNW